MSGVLDKEFKLLLRTEELSPPIIDCISFAFGSITFGYQIFNAIKAKRESFTQKSEVHRNLFGFCANADFITNNTDDEYSHRLALGEETIWLTSDLIAAEEAIGHLMPIFKQRPKLNDIKKKTKDGPSPKLERNIVSFGGPCRNLFSRWMMKLEDPPPGLGIDVAHTPIIPFTFNYELSESKHLSWDARAKIQPRPNWPIRDIRCKRDIYIPETYYFDDNTYICKRDYAMIVKMKSIQAKSRQEGKWNLMISGSHGSGTEGAAMALGNEKILNRIWHEVGEKDFQAIVAVDVETNEEEVCGKTRKFGKPTRVELLEVVELSI